MTADLLKRLFRSIHTVGDPDLMRVAAAITEDERRKGHGPLAHQLDQILSRPVPSARRPGGASSPWSPQLGPLPTSKRYQEPLTTPVHPESLRHHMVLPPAVEERFRRIEQEFSGRDRLMKFGLWPRRRVLLYGPPGCGKSLGAERLAWTTGLPLLKVRFDSIISSFFGESAANLRSVFEAAIGSPCLLFLDECDFVARSRMNPNDVGEAPRIVNALLQLLEDYAAPGLLVAATNLDNALDKAIFRRFDDVFEVPLPGPDEVSKLLQTTLSAIEVSTDVRWPELVSALRGMSAASVVKAGQDAAKAAILRSDLPVRHEHLEVAITELRRTD